MKLKKTIKTEIKTELSKTIKSLVSLGVNKKDIDDQYQLYLAISALLDYMTII